MTIFRHISTLHRTQNASDFAILYSMTHYHHENKENLRKRMLSNPNHDTSN